MGVKTGSIMLKFFTRSGHATFDAGGFFDLYAVVRSEDAITCSVKVNQRLNRIDKSTAFISLVSVPSDM